MRSHSFWGDEIPIGNFFERTDVPTCTDHNPVVATEPWIKQSSRILRCGGSICGRIDVGNLQSRQTQQPLMLFIS